jgi:hypothetical protein
MRMKRREAQRQGPRDVRELGHAGVRLDCWNSSPSGCDRPPPGMTRKPGFLSHGDRPFAPVIFRQDTPCHEQGQGINGDPQRGPDRTDHHGIASRPQGPGRQSPRSRQQPKGDRTQGFTTNGVTRMSPSALLRLEALRKCNTASNWVNADLYRLLYKTDLSSVA